MNTDLSIRADPGLLPFSELSLVVQSKTNHDKLKTKQESGHEAAHCVSSFF
jgi:hypothetical protein